jgi:hypothetical protein
MNLDNRAREDFAYKVGVPQAWARGDYHRFASDLVWPLGAELVSACQIRPRRPPARRRGWIWERGASGRRSWCDRGGLGSDSP